MVQEMLIQLMMMHSVHYPSYYESLQDYVAVLKQGHFAGAWKATHLVTKMQQQLFDWGLWQIQATTQN